MREPVNIDDYRPHEIYEAICVKCCQRWIAAIPVGVPLRDVECVNCGPGFVISTGQPLEDFDEETDDPDAA